MSNLVSSVCTRSRRKRMLEDRESADCQKVWLELPDPAPTKPDEIVSNDADISTRHHIHQSRCTTGQLTDCQSQSQPPQPSLVSSHEHQPTPVNPQFVQAESSGAIINVLQPMCLADPIPCNPSQSLATQPDLGPSQEKPIEPGDFLSIQAGCSAANSIVESGNTERRTRGPTRCLSVWWRPAGMRKIPVATNRQRQPIGPKASRLSNFLGTLARDGKRAPLTYVDWRAMPEANKEDLWELVQSKFDIDPIAKSWVMKSLGKKWRDWKGKLKANHYSRWETDEERLQDRDERVLEEQWQALIKFWNSKKEKVRSDTNKANRARLKFLHTAGTKSFARIREEERVKRPDGEEPDRTDIFIVTHKRKDGRTLNDAMAEVISKLQSQTSIQPNPLQQGTTGEDIFSQVMGEDRRGRVRTYGLGVSPSDLWGPTPSRKEALRIASEAKSTSDELCKMRETMEAMMQKYTALEAEHTAMKDQMARFFSTIQKHPLGAVDCLVFNNTSSVPSSADRESPSHKGASTSNVGSSGYQRCQRKRGKINHGKNCHNS